MRGNRVRVFSRKRGPGFPCVGRLTPSLTRPDAEITQGTHPMRADRSKRGTTGGGLERLIPDWRDLTDDELSREIFRVMAKPKPTRTPVPRVTTTADTVRNHARTLLLVTLSKAWSLARTLSVRAVNRLKRRSNPSPADESP